MNELNSGVQYVRKPARQLIRVAPLKRLLQICLVLASAGTLLVTSPSAFAAGDDLQAATAAFEAHDYETAHKLFTPAAVAGSAHAQYHSGMMHRFGWGVDKDFKKARELFEQAAAQGHAESQSELGKIYKDGRGVERNAETAVKWFTEAAKGGLGIAQLNLARMYRAGQGVPKDAKQAYVWFSLAIKSQYMDAIGHRQRLADDMSEADIEAAKTMTAKMASQIKAAK